MSRSATRTPAAHFAYIPLRELATITLDTGASYIYHEPRSAIIPIKFSVRGRDLGSTVAEAQERITKNVKLPRAIGSYGPASSRNCKKLSKRLEIDRAAEPRADHGAAAGLVQLAARQPIGAGRHPFAPAAV
jgi:hypothetical protein